RGRVEDGRGDLRGVQGHRQHGAAPVAAARRQADLPGPRRQRVRHAPRGDAARRRRGQGHLEAASCPRGPRHAGRARERARQAQGDLLERRVPAPRAEVHAGRPGLTMFESVQSLLAEHDELQEQLADPELHSDPARSKRVNRRYAELARIVAAYNEWSTLTDDVAAATEMAADDASIAGELPAMQEQLDAAQEKLRRLLDRKSTR